MIARFRRCPHELRDETLVFLREIGRSGMMKESNEDRSQGDLELDLRDVMLDLDPGMLTWTAPRTR